MRPFFRNFVNQSFFLKRLPTPKADNKGVFELKHNLQIIYLGEQHTPDVEMAWIIYLTFCITSEK